MAQRQSSSSLISFVARTEWWRWHSEFQDAHKVVNKLNRDPFIVKLIMGRCRNKASIITVHKIKSNLVDWNSLNKLSDHNAIKTFVSLWSSNRTPWETASFTTNTATRKDKPHVQNLNISFKEQKAPWGSVIVTKARTHNIAMMMMMMMVWIPKKAWNPMGKQTFTPASRLFYLCVYCTVVPSAARSYSSLLLRELSDCCLQDLPGIQESLGSCPQPFTEPTTCNMAAAGDNEAKSQEAQAG